MKIIITGASRGIGYQTVLRLCETGRHHILAISRDEKKLDELAAFCRINYPESEVFPCALDLRQGDFSAIEQAVKTDLEGLDVIIHNAGSLINKPFEALTWQDWQDIYQVNLFSPALLTKSLLPFLKESENAHIVNIGSMGGFQGSSKFPGLSAYSSSKAALANLTECLAEELKPYSIKVNCLALGAVQTEMLAEAFPGYQAPTTAAQMAEYIAYFCLNGHHYFNGKILPVAGGYL